jgi:hypothetical protein
VEAGREDARKARVTAISKLVKSLVAWLALAAAGACSQAPRAPSAQVFTLFDAQSLLASHGPEHHIALDAGLPGGVSLTRMIDAAGARLAKDDTRTAEYKATYVTTEVWSHFDRLWVQPMYVLVTGWVDGKPTVVLPEPDGPRSWIFGVGPDSGFYSPFWQMVYVDVGDEATARALTSARQIVEGGYKLHPGPGRMASLKPDDLMAPEDTAVGSGRGWLDGKPVSFFDFGGSTFSWDAEGVINELPIYVFLMRDGAGNWVAPNIPTIAGVGPPNSGVRRDTLPPQIGGQGRWASYWRVYTVMLPPAARIVAPMTRDLAIYESLVALNVARVDDINPAVYADERQIGQVVLNPLGTGADGGPAGCFVDGQGCLAIESQFDVEVLIDPSMIRRTDVTVTCPFVIQDGVPVRPLL